MKKGLHIEKENLKEVFFSSHEISNSYDMENYIEIVKGLYENHEIIDNLVVMIELGNDPVNKEIKSEDDISQMVKLLEEGLDELTIYGTTFFKSNIYISKHNSPSSDMVTFYSKESFYNYLTKSEDKKIQLKFLEILSKFDFLNNCNQIRLLNLNHDSNGKIIVESEFINFDKKQSDKEVKKRLVKISELSNSQTKINFVPDQFLLTADKEDDFQEFEQLINKIQLFLSIKSISNFTEINGDQINFRIVGTKLIEGYFNFKNENVYDKDKNIFKIYKWIYSSDNIDERLEISRHVLTLYYDGDSLLNNSSMFLPSIKSNFEIYLKDNVDRYIDVLNNVVVLLKDLNKEVTNYSNELVTKFKTNFIGFFSFFVTTILFNILSEQKLDNIFTKDITMITFAFLCISICFLGMSILELNSNKARIEKNYEADKNYYTLLLNKDDVERIFNYDKNFNDDIEYLEGQKKLIIWFWIVVIIIILILVIFKGTINDNGVLIYKDILNFFKN